METQSGTLLSREGERRAPHKILIHGLNYWPEPIGVGKYTAELAEYLAGRGHRVEVVTAPPHYPNWTVSAPYRGSSYSRERRNEVDIIRCPIFTRQHKGGLKRLVPPLTFAMAAAPQVMYRILRTRPDVVLCVEPTLFSAPAALLAAKLVGSRTVLHVQDLEVDAAFSVGHIKLQALRRIALAIESVVLGRFDQVITISRRMSAKLISKGVAPSRCSIIRNWIDTDVIFPLDAAPVAFRHELEIGHSQYVVLYSGHLGAKQALPVIVDAARRLKNHNHIVFVIAGEGPERGRLMAQAAELPNVRFLTLQPMSRLNELLNTADLHVLPQSKGVEDLVLPSKLAGMLASGRPIVVMADPDTELALLLAKAAIVVPSGSDEALAAAIVRAVAEDHRTLIQEGFRIVRSLESANVLRSFELSLTSTNRGSDR